MMPCSTTSCSTILDVTMKFGSMAPAFNCQRSEPVISASFNIALLVRRAQLTCGNGRDDLLKVSLDIYCGPDISLLTQSKGIGHDRGRSAPDRHVYNRATHTQRAHALVQSDLLASRIKRNVHSSMAGRKPAARLDHALFQGIDEVVGARSGSVVLLGRVRVGYNDDLDAVCFQCLDYGKADRTCADDQCRSASPLKISTDGVPPDG
jgi:hypothetical protein